MTTLAPCRECGETVDSSNLYCDDCRPEHKEEAVHSMTDEDVKHTPIRERKKPCSDCGELFIPELRNIYVGTGSPLWFAEQYCDDCKEENEDSDMYVVIETPKPAVEDEEGMYDG